MEGDGMENAERELLQVMKKPPLDEQRTPEEEFLPVSDSV